MDRVTQSSASLADIAGFWSREPTAVYAEEQIVAILVQAIWLGQLVVQPPAGHVPLVGDYRYSLLRAVASVRTHPGLLFLRPGDPVAPAIADLPDGGALVDIGQRINWVADGAEPDAAVAEAAFSALASAEMDDYDEVTVVPILRALLVEREALRRYCERARIPLPKFWFAPTPARSTVSAERLCERWLSDLARTGAKPGSKSRVRDDALSRFPGLSGAAFARVWKKVAPSAWKESGAPTKPKRHRGD